MDTISQATLVIFSSPDGKTGWKPVLPRAVPEWLKDVDVMGKLKNGVTAMKDDLWFMALTTDEVSAAMMHDTAAIQKAIEKRTSKNSKRRILRVLH